MSRKATLLLFIALLLPFSAMAADAKVHSEIVYRANLGRADDVKLLLKQGASAKDKDDNGTPLVSLAAARKDPEGLNVLKVLLDSGADINARDIKGQTPLFYAASKGNLNTVRYLLSKGIDYYALDNNGDIARTIAFNAGHKDIVEAMDNFVKAQTEKRKAEYEHFKEQSAKRKTEYEQFNKAAQQPQKPAAPAPAKPGQPAPANAQKPAMPAAPAPGQKPAAAAPAKPGQPAANAQKPGAPAAAKPTPPAPAAKPAPTPEDIQKAKEAQQKAKEEQEQAAAARKKQQDAMFKDLAFNYCAFQYWSFVNDSHQSSEMSPDVLDSTIFSYKDKIEAIYAQMEKMQLPRDRIIDISHAARQRIFDEMQAIPSKSERHEQGIGQKSDMQWRCNIVARHWEEVYQPPRPSAPARRGAEPPPPAVQPTPRPSIIVPTRPFGRRR
ncbi:MAG: ankyrin repeat domain-containing protein [Pseudomonadota bacterium]|nr:ankyrin repeat domain-containing protein [Pseudomonadota bacterium]